MVAGNDIKPFGCGKSAFRFLVPRQKILDNPATEKFASRDGYMTMWYGNDRRLVMYPCSNNTMMNFVGIHPSELSASKGNGKSFSLARIDRQRAVLTRERRVGWDRDGSKAALLDIYRDFGSSVQALLDMVDNSVLKVWTLLDMEQLPSWVKGKLVLVGDAAHPFLPRKS